VSAGLEAALRARLASGGRCFVPYVTGGYPGVDADLLLALQDAGADAIEVGVPFSDPVMDGGVIQEASAASLEAGTTPSHVRATIEKAALDVPVAVMTYANPMFRPGFDASVDEAKRAGVAGIIVPDLPFDEADDWIAACRAREVATVFLAAPGESADRLAGIARASTGFLYCVSTFGVTGARDRLAGTADELVASLRAVTDLPLLVGVGIGTPEQAAEACSFADGVVVGSALMAELLAGNPDGAVALARRFRAAIPAGAS
jgi:tryptophan synthase alpha chain